jgi:hypothetical protein
MSLCDLNSIRINAHGEGIHQQNGGAKRHNICSMRLGTRENWLRGKHNPSADLLQP